MQCLQKVLNSVLQKHTQNLSTDSGGDSKSMVPTPALWNQILDFQNNRNIKSFIIELRLTLRDSKPIEAC